MEVRDASKYRVAVILLILENPTSATSDNDKECVFRCLKPTKNYTDDQRRCR
ncbi:hypothetical protein DPMN_117993, partial [Dreissena polymorpha]